MDATALAGRVKSLALAAGFDLAGIARADAPPKLAYFAEWIDSGYAGEMSYLTAQVAKRRDLHAAFSWARSLICVGLQYDTPAPYSTQAPAERGWVSRYAWGDDYHDVMKAMLDRLLGQLRSELGPFEARSYADTGPIVERVFAAEAGLGGWGKNTCLLHPEHGSWFFLGELVTDLDLVADAPRPDMCGSCTACLEACPTGALHAPYRLDATRCISYLTIEVKGSMPEAGRRGLGRHVFGCDICQDVCPWNRKRRRRGAAAFEARPGMAAPDLAELAGLDEEGFRRRFQRSPLRRAKRRGLLRNVAVALANVAGDSSRAVLERLSRDADAVVREHAVWALRQIDESPAL